MEEHLKEAEQLHCLVLPLLHKEAQLFHQVLEELLHLDQHLKQVVALHSVKLLRLVLYLVLDQVVV